jgi:hypothetical protein
MMARGVEMNAGGAGVSMMPSNTDAFWVLALALELTLAPSLKKNSVLSPLTKYFSRVELGTL